MSPTDREHLVTNIVAHASAGVTPEVQARVVQYWTNVDADLGGRVATGLGVGEAIRVA
jgi:catalase